MSRFSPGCACCGGREPCANCASGFAPNTLKLVVPSGTFTSNMVEVYDEDTGEFVSQPSCPTAPACDFYAGTYFFTLDPACTSNCCCYTICFDTDDASGCDCGEDQSTNCPAFCSIEICINAPGFIEYLDRDDENYNLTVWFYGGKPGDSTAEPPCGSCDFRTAGVNAIIFTADLGVTVPDCSSFDSLSCALVQNVTLGANGDCLAASGATVEVSFVS